MSNEELRGITAYIGAQGSGKTYKQQETLANSDNPSVIFTQTEDWNSYYQLNPDSGEHWADAVQRHRQVAIPPVPEIVHDVVQNAEGLDIYADEGRVTFPSKGKGDFKKEVDDMVSLWRHRDVNLFVATQTFRSGVIPFLLDCANTIYFFGVNGKREAKLLEDYIGHELSQELINWTPGDYVLYRAGRPPEANF